MAPLPYSGLDRHIILIVKVSRLHSDTPHSVGLLWKNDRLHNTQNSKQAHIHAPAGFEHTIPASERPQTQSLDRAANGISS